MSLYTHFCLCTVNISFLHNACSDIPSVSLFERVAVLRDLSDRFSPVPRPRPYLHIIAFEVCLGDTLQEHSFLAYNNLLTSLPNYFRPPAPYILSSGLSYCYVRLRN